MLYGHLDPLIGIYTAKNFDRPPSILLIGSVKDDSAIVKDPCAASGKPDSVGVDREERLIDRIATPVASIFGDVARVSRHLSCECYWIFRYVVFRLYYPVSDNL